MVDSAIVEIRDYMTGIGWSRFSFRGQSSGKFDNFALDILGELIDVKLCTLDAEALGEVNATVLAAFNVAGSTGASKNQKVTEPSRLSWLKKVFIQLFIFDVVP